MGNVDTRGKGQGARGKKKLKADNRYLKTKS